MQPVPVATRSEAWVCDRPLLARTPPKAWMSVFVSVVCCQVEVPATGRSLVQSIPTQCGVFDSMLS